VITHIGKVMLAGARVSLGSAASLAPYPDLARRATEVDFAVASRIDSMRALLLKPARVTMLSGRLRAQIDALERLKESVPPAAAKDLDAHGEQLQWLLNELHHNT
jgi:hypothetical protein